jgi:hypothetical protein
MQENKEESYTVNGNKIVLQRIEHDSKPMGRCCHRWNGKYKVIKSTLRLNKYDIETLKNQNVFGCGQVVNAHLVEDVIEYSGVCDSSD